MRKAVWRRPNPLETTLSSWRSSQTNRLAVTAVFALHRARCLAASVLPVLAAPPHLACAAQATPERRSNIVVFVGDDLGWRDTGPYGNAAIRTPNIDCLARSGLRVTPAAYRGRDDNTDRITGVPFTSKIPPLRNPDGPPPGERWGHAGPS